MSIYRWAMKFGALILFITSLLIFLISIGANLMSGENAWSSVAGELNPSFPRIWFFMLAVINALSSSALTFFGACLLYRVDVALRGREAAE